MHKSNTVLHRDLLTASPERFSIKRRNLRIEPSSCSPAMHVPYSVGNYNCNTSHMTCDASLVTLHAHIHVQSANMHTHTHIDAYSIVYTRNSIKQNFCTVCKRRARGCVIFLTTHPTSIVRICTQQQLTVNT